MAHVTDRPYLNRKNMELYLDKLAVEILNRGIGRTRILIVGGSAIALKHKFRNSTVDIDICIRENNGLYQCVLDVANKYKIPEDWINADVMHSLSFSYRLFENAQLHKVYRDILEVWVVSDLDLLCMKLKSGRVKDIEDAKHMVKILKKDGVKLTQDTVRQRLVYLYSTSFLPERSNTFMMYGLK